MGMDPKGYLAYGIDFGEEKPAFIGSFDGDLAEWAYSEAGGIIEPLHYFVDGHVVLAVPDHVHTADYGSLVTDIESLDVDPAKLRAYKEALTAAGYPDPQPGWLLTFSMD